MTKQTAMAAATAMLFLFFSKTCDAQLQPDPKLQQVQNFINGQRIQIYWRVGGPLYGKHHLLNIKCDRSGKYRLIGRTSQTTVLDNTYTSNWVDRGSWRVVRLKNQIGIQLKSTGGGMDFFPIQPLSNGTLRLLSNYFPRNPDRCWIAKGWKLRL